MWSSSVTGSRWEASREVDEDDEVREKGLERKNWLSMAIGHATARCGRSAGWQLDGALTAAHGERQSHGPGRAEVSRGGARSSVVVEEGERGRGGCRVRGREGGGLGERKAESGGDGGGRRWLTGKGVVFELVVVFAANGKQQDEDDQQQESVVRVEEQKPSPAFLVAPTAEAAGLRPQGGQAGRRWTFTCISGT